jgi:hypothetical protein
VQPTIEDLVLQLGAHCVPDLAEACLIAQVLPDVSDNNPRDRLSHGVRLSPKLGGAAGAAHGALGRMGSGFSGSVAESLDRSTQPIDDDVRVDLRRRQVGVAK